MAAHTKYDEKIITIEDTLELHLDKIFPERDIVAMKTNNIASYADVLVTCMRQNPRWILLSEVRSAEAVMAVRDSISSGHNILSTIHADKAESIPSRLYSLLESSIDMDQFLRSIHRYVQLGVHIKGYYSKELQRFKREVAEVVEFYVDDDNKPGYNIIYKRTPDGKTVLRNPTKYLLGYLESQGVIMEPDILVKEQFHETSNEGENNSVVAVDSSKNQTNIVNTNKNIVPKNVSDTNINNQQFVRTANLTNPNGVNVVGGVVNGSTPSNYSTQYNNLKNTTTNFVTQPSVFPNNVNLNQNIVRNVSANPNSTFVNNNISPGVGSVNNV